MQRCTDADVLDAAAAVIGDYGYAGLTLARAAGTSRMTLHGRQVALQAVVAGLALRAAAEFQAALFPVLAGIGPARDRLLAALDAVSTLPTGTCDCSPGYTPSPTTTSSTPRPARTARCQPTRCSSPRS